MVILDTRTPEEYRRFCIPGGRSVPGGELALRITDLTADLDPGHHRHRQLRRPHPQHHWHSGFAAYGPEQRPGVEERHFRWVLAGYELESGADRVDLPEPTAEGLAAAEAYADRLAAEDGVRYLDISALREMLERAKTETVYFVDVRTAAEYAEGHIPASAGSLAVRRYSVPTRWQWSGTRP